MPRSPSADVAPRVDGLRQWVLVAALVGGLAAIAGVGARATYSAQVSGDEPFYLMTAQSLVSDGDLDLREELATQAYLPYHQIPIEPQTIALDATGTQVSPHDPLLPLMLAPAMALPPSIAWIVAKLLLAVTSAATAGLTVSVAVRRLAVRPLVAGLVVAGLAASLPWAGYGTQVYPELPAGLLVLGAVAAATGPRLSRSQLAIVVAVVAALPWLAVKYVPVALAIAITVGARAWSLGRRHDVLAAAGVLTAAGVAYLAFHLQVYGGWTVYAAGDHFVDSGELAVMGTRPDYLGRSRRLVGLLVDRRFGMASWAPLWLAAPAGLVVLTRRAGSVRSVVLAPILAAWLTATFVALTMHGWWVPGRQVVVVVPLLALGIAALADQVLVRAMPTAPAQGVMSVAGRVLVLGGLVAGVTNWLWLAAEATTGGPVLIIDFADSAAPLRRVLAPILPDGVAGGFPADLGLVLWGVALGLTVLCASVRGRPAAPAPVSPLDRVHVGVSP